MPISFVTAAFPTSGVISAANENKDDCIFDKPTIHKALTDVRSLNWIARHARLVPRLLQTDRWIASDYLSGAVRFINSHETLCSTLQHTYTKARYALIPKRGLTGNWRLQGLQGSFGAA